MQCVQADLSPSKLPYECRLTPQSFAPSPHIATKYPASLKQSISISFSKGDILAKMAPSKRSCKKDSMKGSRATICLDLTIRSTAFCQRMLGLRIYAQISCDRNACCTSEEDILRTIMKNQTAHRANKIKLVQNK